jgi:hypothetical protein
VEELSASYEGEPDIQSQLDRQHESGFAPHIGEQTSLQETM